MMVVRHRIWDSAGELIYDDEQIRVNLEQFLAQRPAGEVLWGLIQYSDGRVHGSRVELRGDIVHWWTGFDEFRERFGV